MRVLLAHTDLAGVTDVDTPATFARTVAEGWERLDDGAVVLRALRGSYHGSRSAFTDLTGCKTAVNGRAVPDLDLPGAGSERVDLLIRRAYSFATAALRKVAELAERPAVSALLMVTVTATDDPMYGAVLHSGRTTKGNGPMSIPTISSRMRQRCCSLLPPSIDLRNYGESPN